MWLHTIPDGGLHLAPLKEAPRDVLDVGTGTGIWATEFAQRYPSSRVLGIDLSDIQSANKPANCTFLLMLRSPGIWCSMGRNLISFTLGC